MMMSQLVGPDADAHLAGLRRFMRAEFHHRFRHIVSHPDERSKLRRKLDHFRYIDERFAEAVPSGDQFPPQLETALKGRGAPSICYVLSSNIDIDGKLLPLREALSQVLEWDSGTFVSCIPGKLAYFHGEDRHHRYILVRD